MPNRNRLPKTLRPGTISEGTLRPEDVVPELLRCAEHVRMSQADHTKIETLRADWDAHDASDEPGEIAAEIWADLVDLLDRYVPPYCYVGAIEGDRAAIGVWVSEDALRDAISDGEVWEEQECDCGLDQRDYHGSAAERYAEAYRVAWNDPRRKGYHRGTCAGRMPQGVTYRLVTSDHGNRTLYTRAGKEVW